MAQKTIDFDNDILRPIGSLKEDLADQKDNKITKFYTNNNGDTTLNDSDDGKIQDLMIYGKSEQAQYKGKNLLNYEKWKTVNIENGTAVFENNGVTLTAIGEDAYTDYRDEKSKILVTVGKTYTLSWESEQIEGSRAFIFPNGMIANSVEVRNEKQVKYTVSAGIDYITFRVGVLKKGKTISFKNIMFEEGSERTDFEPYTGGKPSPSPEYPQEIKAVVNPVIKTHGKNLWSGKNTERYWMGNNETVNNECVSSDYIPIKGSQTIYAGFSYDWFIGFTCYDSKKNKILGSEQHLNDTQENIEKEYRIVHSKTKTPKNTAFIKIMFSKHESKPYVSIVEGKYEPYHEQTAVLPYTLYAIPVSSGGNVTIDGQQYIADYVDVEHGKLVRKTHVTKFTGAENWTYTDVDNEQLRRFGLSMQGKNVPYFGLSNYVINGNTSVIGRVNVFAVYRTWIDVRINKFTSLVEFKNFLSEINSSGKPMIVIYALATPEEIDLTPEAVEAFKALSTYYPKTYINAESEQLEAYTMFNYPVSMEKGWEYVKQQIGDTRKYVYDMDTKTQDIDTQSAEAYVNSEYAVALTELEM